MQQSTFIAHSPYEIGDKVNITSWRTSYGKVRRGNNNRYFGGTFV